jgi:hypothetical protein
MCTTCPAHLFLHDSINLMICKIVFLDFIHHLNEKIIKSQHFGSWILLPSSGKKREEDRNPICWAPLVQLASDLDQAFVKLLCVVCFR